MFHETMQVVQQNPFQVFCPLVLRWLNAINHALGNCVSRMTVGTGKLLLMSHA